MTPVRPGFPLTATFALVIAALLATLGAGCSSEDPGPVGAALVDASIDTVLQLQASDRIVAYRPVTYDESAAPFNERQALFMGRRGTERSAMLFNYDFSALVEEGWTPELVTFDNIIEVEIWLSMLTPYFRDADADTVDAGGSVDLQKSYVVRELIEPFDPADYPGPIPPTIPGTINANTSPEPAGGRIFLDVPKARFITWYHTGGTIGLLIEEGDDNASEEGFTGYAARDLREFSLIDRELVGTTVGTIIHVEFTEGVGDTAFFLNLAPVEDVSTLDTLDEAPTGLDTGMMVRTHERSYPLLLFDLSSLPANILINRARLLIAADTTRSYGPNAEGLVVGELDTTLVPASVAELDLADLSANVYQISGQNSLIPEQTGPLAFNVAPSIQRYVNQAYAGTRGFVIYAGESFSSYRQSLATTPRTLLQRFWFYGNDAPADSLRPQLRISYTRNDAITGEGP